MKNKSSNRVILYELVHKQGIIDKSTNQDIYSKNTGFYKSTLEPQLTRNLLSIKNTELG